MFRPRAADGRTPRTYREITLQLREAAHSRAGQTSDALEEQIAYWRNLLAQPPPRLVVPADGAGSAASDAETTLAVPFPQVLCRDLETLALRSGCSLFVTLYAAFATLMHRYTQETDVCIGTSAGTLNTLALRADLSGDPTFVEFVSRAKTVVLDAFTNQDAPLESVLDALRPAHGGAAELPFSVTFDLLEVATRHAPAVLPKVDLRLSVQRGPGAPTLRFEFEPDRLDAGTVGRLAEHFLHLLESTVREPDARLSQLALMGADERRRVLAFGAGERTAYERDASIQALFSEQASRSPQAIAVRADDGSLTYAELEMRANRFANYLRALGVEAEAGVGVALERALELPVVLLGILKAGAAYVPLDASYPRERLEFILADASVELIVTQRSLRERLPIAPERIVTLEEDAAGIAAQPAHAPEVACGPDALAYVMYTSGSTGRPKGAAIVHRSVVRLVRSTNYVEISEDDCVLQYAPLAFDASTFELWAPLLNGAQLAMAPPSLLSLTELGRTIERLGVTTLWLTAPIFREMVESKVSGLGGLRRLLTGGDVVPPQQAARFLAVHPNCRLINGYGPTENTTFSCCYPIPRAEASASNIPIGRPIANSTAYVVDRHLQVVPFGVPGELCVGGDGLAREYLNLPELTAERFVPDPIANDPQARLYHTGDRVRLRPDGLLEFMGRIDEQVKIRGFRVELGEIEAALRLHPDVREAVVVVAVAAGEKALFAFVVAAPGASLGERALRTYLSGKLPGHMVPNRLTLLARLPEHASGKHDRQALVRLAATLPPASAQAAQPAPAATPASNGARKAPGMGLGNPNAALQRSIGEIWREMLGGDQPPKLDENFFDAGGDSLRLLRVHARLQQTLHIDLDIMDLFDHCTIRKLAAFVASKANAK